MNDQDRNEWLENLERRLTGVEEQLARWEKEVKDIRRHMRKLNI